MTANKIPNSVRKVKIAMALLLSALPLVIIRILRPVIVIRFGQLRSFRIGGYIGLAENYLSERDIGMHKGRYVDVFFHHTEAICNYQLKKMWDRTIRVIQISWAIDRLNRVIPGGKIHTIPWPVYSDQDDNFVLHRTKPHLRFTQEEIKEGEAALSQMGITPGVPFVCFHARDWTYEVDLGAIRIDETTTPANSDINTYLPAIEKLTRKGFYGLRMGAVVERPIVTTNPMVIDYASKFRTDLLDLYLSARCSFFLGSTSGIVGIPMAFRRPTIHANFVSMQHFRIFPFHWQPHDLWIPKKFWLRDESRFMTMSEILRSLDDIFAGLWWQRETGIELVDNSPEEIMDVSMEMAARLDGTWQTTKEDEELQHKFWNLADPEGDYKFPHSRIGAKFLRDHLDTLD